MPSSSAKCVTTLNISSFEIGVKCPQGHELQLCSQDNGWGCDGRHDAGGCKRGITGFGQTTGVPRFRCDACDYDLCDACFEHKKGNVT
jgi:hypothetical protein